LSKVYISLGTNLGNKSQNLKTACDLISKNIGTIEQKSSIYETEPWGFDSFNNFLNQVIEVETELKPEILLQRLLLIEEKMGRKTCVAQ
jgi:2-amino-4-hydroxy-6-hydroxymethyldihydropteridine diphosphokinase